LTAGRPPDVTALRMLRRARDRIDRDFAEPLDIASLAAAAGYSRAHFIRAFHDTYGETPGRYRARRRVERACELLRSVNLTVTETGTASPSAQPDLGLPADLGLPTRAHPVVLLLLDILQCAFQGVPCDFH
jgi:hypothetical protein